MHFILQSKSGKKRLNMQREGEEGVEVEQLPV